jgi:hypothetical protein
MIGALRDRGAEPIVLDSAAVPSALPVTLAYDRAGARGAWGGAEPRAGEPITAIWQMAAVGLALPAMAPGVRETCVAASEAALVGLLDNLGAFQIDPVWSQRRAEHKPAQLRLAREFGLAIPRTLISSDAAAVRAFADRVGPVIAKMLVPDQSGEPNGDGGGDPGEAEVMFTTAMTPEDLAQLDGLELCPMIFQERISGARDVRVVIAGPRVFAAALDADAGAGDDVDWRRASYAADRAPRWAPYDLPRELADQLGRLIDRLGLNYAAIDLLAGGDRHVFLELNPRGSFAFLGAELAAPIAAAIADALIDPAARRPAARDPGVPA